MRQTIMAMTMAAVLSASAAEATTTLRANAESDSGTIVTLVAIGEPIGDGSGFLGHVRCFGRCLFRRARLHLVLSPDQTLTGTVQFRRGACVLEGGIDPLGYGVARYLCTNRRRTRVLDAGTVFFGS